MEEKLILENLQKIDDPWFECNAESIMNILKENGYMIVDLTTDNRYIQRYQFRKVFDAFMDIPTPDDWLPPDDALLWLAMIAGLEIFTGEHGEEVMKDIFAKGQLTYTSHKETIIDALESYVECITNAGTVTTDDANELYKIRQALEVLKNE